MAPSASIGLAGVLEGDRAALAALAAELEREPLEVQLVLQAGLLPVLGDARRASAPGPQAQVSRSRQSGHRSSRSLEVEHAVDVGVQLVQGRAPSWRSARSGSSSRKIIRSGVGDE